MKKKEIDLRIYNKTKLPELYFTIEMLGPILIITCYDEKTNDYNIIVKQNEKENQNT